MVPVSWVIHCDCGTDVTGSTEEEFVERAQAHAKTSHALTMTRDQVLALATVEGETTRPKT
jgi:predicted small metal-binding protein